MASINLNGTAFQDLAGTSMVGTGTLKLGRAVEPIARSADDPVFMVTDVPLGNTERRQDVGFISDRAPNVPSGYEANGEPTYGQGKLNRNTTFSADYSRDKTNNKFGYYNGAKFVNKKFSELST